MDPNPSIKLKSRLVEWLVVVIALLALIYGAHRYVTDRLGVLRSLYPITIPLYRINSRCSDESPAWMRDVLNHAISVQHSPANQLAYINASGKLFHCENGWIGSVWHGKPVESATRFRYASLTKVLTADLVLQFINKGMVSMDTRLMSYFPEIKAGDKRINDITIEHLLTHSMGLDRLKQSAPMTRHNKKPWCPGDLRQLESFQLDYAPGSMSTYSNLSYCLLGVVLEKISGNSYRELMEEYYSLGDKGIKFIDGPYLDDEVSYDFRYSDFYQENYHEFFDFPALSSSMGLSGSASALASIVSRVKNRGPLSVTNYQPSGVCDKKRIMHCFGAGLSHYKPEDDGGTFYVQSGLVYGAASQLVIDGHGGVLVWLGSGMSGNSAESSRVFAEFVYKKLSN